MSAPPRRYATSAAAPNSRRSTSRPRSDRGPVTPGWQRASSSSPFPSLPLVLHRRSERLRQRDHRRPPRRHRHLHLGWHLASAEHRHLHVQRRPRHVDRRRLHTSLLHPLDRRDNPRRATLASASGLAKASRRSRVTQRGACASRRQYRFLRRHSENTHMECGLSSAQGLFAPRLAGLSRRGERIGCRRRLCRDSYARVGAA